MAAVTKTQEQCSEYFVEEDFVKKANLRTMGHLKWHEQNVLKHSVLALPCLMEGRHQPGRCIRPNAET